MKVSKTAVHIAIKKFQNKGTFKDSKISGRLRISSIWDYDVIRKVVSKSMSSAKKYWLEWQKEVSKLLKRHLGIGYLSILA